MKWIFCFRKSQNIGLWRLFTLHRPQFGHVYCSRYEPDIQSWIVSECASQKINIDILRGEEADLLVHDMLHECVCVEIEQSNEFIHAPRWLYCTSFATHVAGIRGLFIFTPYQLYCELIRRGGRIIFDNQE